MLQHLLRDRRVLALLALLALTIAVVAVSSVSALASSPQPVKVGDDFFSAKRLTIRKGTQVTWKWTGVLRHNVTVRTGPSSFHSRTQVFGSFSHVFTRKGTYTLYCTLHRFMRMTIVVK
jgi:plastocyanin